MQCYFMRKAEIVENSTWRSSFHHLQNFQKADAPIENLPRIYSALIFIYDSPSVDSIFQASNLGVGHFVYWIEIFFSQVQKKRLFLLKNSPVLNLILLPNSIFSLNLEISSVLTRSSDLYLHNLELTFDLQQSITVHFSVFIFHVFFFISLAITIK